MLYATDVKNVLSVLCYAVNESHSTAAFSEVVGGQEITVLGQGGTRQAKGLSWTILFSNLSVVYL